MCENIGKNILVVEDELDTAEFINQVLKDTGYSVMFATTGTEALKKVKEHNLDLVILDVMLPEIDGYTLQLEILNHPPKKDLPVIVITALSSTQKLFKVLPQVRGFIQKPFTADDIMKAVNLVFTDNIKVQYSA